MIACIKGKRILASFKLKHNSTFEMLAHLCRISNITTIDYFWKWLIIMYTKLKFLIKMQDCGNIFKTTPPLFKSKFPRLTSIIDWFEVFLESPGAFLARAQRYNNNNKHCTIKKYISFIPLESIIFLSKYWGG